LRQAIAAKSADLFRSQCLCFATLNAAFRG
jgi:hypothetical protein